MVKWLQRALSTSGEALRRHPYYVEHPDRRPALDAAFAAMDLALSPEWASDALPGTARHPAAIRLTGAFRNQFWDVVELGMALDIASRDGWLHGLVGGLQTPSQYESFVFEALTGAWLTLAGEVTAYERPELGLEKKPDFTLMADGEPRLIIECKVPDRSTKAERLRWLANGFCHRFMGDHRIRALGKFTHTVRETPALIAKIEAPKGVDWLEGQVESLYESVVRAFCQAHAQRKIGSDFAIDTYFIGRLHAADHNGGGGMFPGFGPDPGHEVRRFRWTCVVNPARKVSGRLPLVVAVGEREGANGGDLVRFAPFAFTDTAASKLAGFLFVDRPPHRGNKFFIRPWRGRWEPNPSPDAPVLTDHDVSLMEGIVPPNSEAMLLAYEKWRSATTG